MSKWLLVSWALVALAAGPSLAGEPAYQGKPLGAWLRSMRSNDPLIRKRAFEILDTIGPEALPSASDLLDALDTEDRTVRLTLARVLARLGPEALPLLIE